MLTSTRITLARSGASPALRVAARRTPLPRHRIAGARFASTTEQAQSAVKASEGSVFSGAGPSTTGRGSVSSHLAAGVAGGVTVLIAGYTAYHFSSIKKAVDAVQTTSNYAKQTRDNVTQSVQKTLKDSNQVLKYLRDVAKSYVALIPGAGSYIDATFDSFEKLAQTHGPEVEKITKGAYDEIQGIYNEAKSKGTVDAEVAVKVADVLRRRLAELYELGKRAGGDVLEELLESHPEIKEQLGGGYEQLRQFANDKSPEAKKLLEDTQRQVKEIFSKGFGADAIAQARDLLQSKAEEARKLAEPAAREAWDKALEQAKPALDKLPEIRDYLNSNASTLATVSAGFLSGGNANEIVQRVKDVASKDGQERQKQVEELKKWLEQQVSGAKGKAGKVLGLGWEDVQKYVKLVPGGDELLDKAPDAKALLELSADRGEDAVKLARETWEDVLKVLEEKGQKAKALAEDTSEDAKGPAEDAKGEAKEKVDEVKEGVKNKAGEVKEKANEKKEDVKGKATGSK